MTPVRGHRTPAGSLLPGWVRVLGLLCVAVLALPIVGLLATVEWSTLGQSLTAHSALIALRLSLLTALAATVLSLLVGLPVALLMARAPAGSMLLRVARTLVLLPLVLPPVVGGIALLSTSGRRGLGGPLTEADARNGEPPWAVVSPTAEALGPGHAVPQALGQDGIAAA